LYAAISKYTSLIELPGYRWRDLTATSANPIQVC